MGVMTPILEVAGIALTSAVIGRILEDSGQGGKAVFVKIVSYIGCGWIALDYWWTGVNHIAAIFGVRL